MVADNEWRDLFFDAAVTHLVSSCSDHLPISLCCEKEPTEQRRARHKQYEIAWEREPSLHESGSAWAEAGNMVHLGDVRQGLQQLMDKLQVWSNEKFCNVTRELEKSRSWLEELLSMNADRSKVLVTEWSIFTRGGW